MVSERKQDGVSAATRRITVLGGTGFVGGAIVRALQGGLAGKIEVTAPARDRFDLTAPGTWPSMDDDTDCVIHAAGLNDGALYDVFAANALYAPALAAFLGERGVRKIVYLSTGSVYGSLNRPASPDTPVNPGSPYATSKYLAERTFMARFPGIVNVLRLYFPYGRGQKPPRLLPSLAARIGGGEPVICNADGGPRLSLTHVDDVAEITVRDFALATTESGVWNIAAPETMTIEDAATRIAAALGTEAVMERSGTACEVTSEPYIRTDGTSWRPFNVSHILG